MGKREEHTLQVARRADKSTAPARNLEADMPGRSPGKRSPGDKHHCKASHRLANKVHSLGIGIPRPR